MCTLTKISPVVSIVIPTYNRKASLLRTLKSLSEQTYPTDYFEVIVVDDGGIDGTERACESVHNINLRYIRQSHRGGTAAKNRGAIEGKGEVVMFLDDDITVNHTYLESLMWQYKGHCRKIVMGVLHNVAPIGFLDDPDSIIDTEDKGCELVHFTECLGGFFSIRRDDFISIGMLQDPAPGCWPNWEDVDLAYRASLQGFTFHKCPKAVGYHWDHVLTSLSIQCERWMRASRTAVKLFRKHPRLEAQIPMFEDKGPVLWQKDSFGLIFRKLARQVSSSRPAMWAMEGIASILENRKPQSMAFRLISRWLVSAYIYQGYREGLQTFERDCIASDSGGSFQDA